MLDEHLKISDIDDLTDSLTTLSAAINLLVIEDNSADFRLIVRHLEKHGLAARCHCVSNIEEMEAAVEQGGWDAVLSDYSVPMLDFQHTLGLLQARHPDLPLILVSGSVGEEKAVDLLKLGVWDFVLKDRLTRLVPAIERSLRDAAVRREQRVAEAALHESAEQFRAMFEMASIGMVQADPRTGQWLRVNQKACAITGYSAAELLQLRIAELTHPEDRQKEAQAFQRVVRGEVPNYRMENRYLRKDGAVAWVNVNMTVIRDAVGHPTRTMTTIEDITDRKQAESYQEMSREVLQILNEPGELHDSMRRVVSTLRKHTGFDAVGIRLQDGEDFPYYAQEGFSKDFLITENSLVERSSNGAICRNQAGDACLECTCGLVISGKTPSDSPLFTPGGSFWTNDSSTLLSIPLADDPRHHPRNLCIHYGYDSVALIPIRTTERVVGTIQFNAHRKGGFTRETVEILEGIGANIGQVVMRKLTEGKLIEAQSLLQAALDSSQAGIAIADAPDGKLRYVNRAGLLIRGANKEEDVVGVVLEKYISSWQLLNMDGTPLQTDQVPLARAIKYGETCSGEFIIRTSESEDRVVSADAAPIFDSSGNIKAAIVVFHDISQEKAREREISDLYDRLAITEQDEKRRIAASLHDCTVQDLVVVQLNINRARQMLNDQDRDVRDILADCEALAESSANELRSLAYDLHAPWLQYGGLLSGVQEYAHQFSIRTGISVLTDVPPAIPRLKQANEIALFRVMQECLLNISRHSGSCRAWILISTSDHILQMTIRDDGGSSSSSRPSTTSGVGILSMHERMKAIGGTLAVSRTDEEFSVQATLPLTEEIYETS